MLKKILMTGVLTASTCAVITANAATPFYVHGQIGYADTHIKSRLESNPANFSNDGLAGRLSLGYKITPRLAVEAGYLQLSNAGPKKGKTTFSNEQYAIDVAAKGGLPITNNVNVYGKLGVAYLTTKLNPNDNAISKRKFAPEVAVGMDYDITPNVTVDTSLTHIQTFGSKRPGNIDFLAVGVGYNFG
ncbi:hypothetical protein BEV13_06715 [Rickettsiella grylli]|uniref:porin family protein n=1 Tax=Rickettsiella grylli TaxID=59196 RepID=UPI0009195066|nr:porin family protein [Rickettsiella grylli]OIZ98463.1 hypothetical protein BEV13_06715 [Rickettsiella grylli]